MIPSQLRYTVEGSTPSFTDNVDQTIERGSQVRVRIKGIRGEMGQMYAIGSIREDYLGCAFSTLLRYMNNLLTRLYSPLMQ
jgi:DNA-directed RNA polymerase II subunit RPB7